MGKILFFVCVEMPKCVSHDASKMEKKWGVSQNCTLIKIPFVLPHPKRETK
jgi:hypothetical protein